MSNEQALLNCTFGWGKTCSLYYDTLEVAGKSYDLKDLTAIQPSYRTMFGVPSARLELSFGLEHLVLRGIADPDIARLMVSHLQPFCSTAPQAVHARSRAKRSRNLARAQAKAWERTNKLPAIFDTPDSTSTASPLKCPQTSSDEQSFAETLPKADSISLDAVPKAPVEDTSLTPGETLEAFAQLANNLSTYTSPLPSEAWQPPHTPRFQPPLHSVHLIPPDQKFDSNSIPVPVVKSSVLPIIHVPVRLQHGECAHYSIGATLCSDRIAKAERATYPVLDQGLLVLTNRRVLYIGKRCQFTLAYTHLWYVSLLHTAIALHIEGQFRRIIIELEHPQEWASRIELLSFIARRARPRSEPPTVSVPAIPGLNMTVKRKALKPSIGQKHISTENATIPLPNGRIVEARIVEAETVEFVEESIQACANLETVDLPLASAETSQEPSKLSRLADQPTSSDMTTRAIAQASSLEDAPTREFSTPADVAQMATREFSLIEQHPTTEMLLPFVASGQVDLASMATREFVLQSLQIPAKSAPTGAQSDLADMATREFSLPSAPDDDSTHKHASHTPAEQDGDSTHKHTARARKRERKLQNLPADTAPSNKHQATQVGGEGPAQRMGAPDNKAANAPGAHIHAEHVSAQPGALPEQKQEDDDDDRTIQLRDRKLSQLRTVSLGEQAEKRANLIPGKPQPRTRAPRRPS